MNRDCMLNFLSIIQSIISVMHFALLFLRLVLILVLHVCFPAVIIPSICFLPGLGEIHVFININK